MTITLPDNDFQDMFISHIRYCLPRHSYMVGEGIRRVIKYWTQLSPNTREVLTRDIRAHIERTTRLLEHCSDKDFTAFEYIDLNSWQNLLQWIRWQSQANPPLEATTAPA